MSKFLTPLIMQDDGDHTFVLRALLAYASDLTGHVEEAEEGFKTDLASAPSICWWLGAGSNLDPGAVIHDKLYSTGKYPKATCDKVFREALLAKGVPAYRAWYCYQAVNWFGFAAWNAHRKKDPKP